MATRKSNTSKTNRDTDETMTVQQAGEMGGRATAETHGREFYEEIGHKGGQRVRELIQEGKEAEGTTADKPATRRPSASEDDFDRAA
jgi:general stress protein YciG